MDRETRLKRLKFRSWHRGTREADLMIGGYFDQHGATWTDAEMDWFETFLEEIQLSVEEPVLPRSVFEGFLC